MISETPLYAETVLATGIVPDIGPGFADDLSTVVELSSVAQGVTLVRLPMTPVPPVPIVVTSERLPSVRRRKPKQLGSGKS